MLRKTLIAAAVVAMIGLQANRAEAANFSFTGSFTQDDNVQLFNFSVGAPSNVTLRTWSYAGGVNAAGNTIARGGFDPILAVFDAAGTLIGQNDDGGPGFVPTDPATGRAWDTFLTVALGAGNYRVTVMEYDNFAVGPNLANGFTRTGQPNFTATFGCNSVGLFHDVSGAQPGCQRDGHWAFDILNVADARVVNPNAVPEPATMLLVASGLAGAVARRRNRKQQAR